MSGRLEGKVAFITGIARGQGRSHAVRLAQEGADIIGTDVCRNIDGVDSYPGATDADMAETVRLVEAEGRRIVAARADVRDYEATKAAVDLGVQELGGLDIVSANSGLFIPEGPAHLVSEEIWKVAVDINLTGVWHTTKATTPYLIDQGRGGSIILTSSTSGHKGTPNAVAYSSAKHGVIGLMRSLAMELGPYGIRVNSIHMTTVLTPMLQNQGVYDLYRPDLENPTEADTAEIFKLLHLLPIPWVEPVDVSNAVLFLASDEARYVTGTELKVDAGNSIK